MIKRVLTGIILIAAVGAGIWLQGWVMRIILLICMALSIHEMLGALGHAGSRPLRWPGYVFAVLAVASQACRALIPGGLFATVDPGLFSLTCGLLLGASAVVLRGKVDYERLSATLMPMLYPGLLFLLILPLQDLSDRHAAVLALILTFFIASVNDMFALFLGLKFGKHRLSPEISPKKSIEGAIAGLAASVLFAALTPVIACAVIREPVALPPVWAFALLGLAAGALSQIGDLTASLVKRHCGIKDFGSIFPGHGGMLDRFDGILFCGAACHLFFKLLGY